MVDYSVNEAFDIYKTENGNFGVVDGREEFQEDLVIQIYNEFQDILEGTKQSDNLTEKVNLLVTRIAKQFGVIEAIERIDVTRPRDKPETLSVTISYSTGDNFQETL